jgi:acyl-coenzyme A thioesterase PaaI-like protein
MDAARRRLLASALARARQGAPIAALMAEPDAFFHADGVRYVPTELPRGPWHRDFMHGGPPAALLARAMEALVPGEGEAAAQVPPLVARFTVEFVRPVPLAPLDVTAEVARAGRQVTHLRAAATAGGQEVCRATALCIRRAHLDLAAVAPAPPPPAGPGASAPFDFPFFSAARGYHTAMECRFARGVFGRGPVAAWMRMRVPLVAGEAPSPLQRVIVAADSGNGVSVVLDLARWTFVNPDLTVYLHRAAQGEWICLDAATSAQPDGVGLADTALHDERGAIGRSLQSLLVAPR